MADLRKIAGLCRLRRTGRRRAQPPTCASSFCHIIQIEHRCLDAPFNTFFVQGVRGRAAVRVFAGPPSWIGWVRHSVGHRAPIAHKMFINVRAAAAATSSNQQQQPAAVEEELAIGETVTVMLLSLSCLLSRYCHATVIYCHLLPLLLLW